MSDTFIRWRADQERRTPRGQFNPLLESHPLVGQPCSECVEPLEVGERPALFAVGPTTREDARRHDEGRWYPVLAVAAHERCLWPEEQPS